MLKGFENDRPRRRRSRHVGKIAGWREIAKTCGYYAPKRKHVQLCTGAWAARQELQDISATVLTDMIASGAPAAG